MEINKLLTMEILYGEDILYENKKELSIIPLSFYDYSDNARSDMMNYKITLFGKLGDENSKVNTLEYIQISSKCSMTNDAAYIELITKYPDLCNNIQSFNLGQYYNVLADSDYDYMIILKVEDTLIKKINNNNVSYKNNCHKLKDVPYNDKLPQQFFINTSKFSVFHGAYNINKLNLAVDLFGGTQYFGKDGGDTQYLYLTFLSRAIISENYFIRILTEQLGFLFEEYDEYIIDKNYFCEKSILETSYTLRFKYYRPIVEEILDWLNNIKKD